jgi:hypothetical protein
MDDNSPSPFHQSFLLRAVICVALMALVFAAGTLLVRDGGDGSETASSDNPIDSREPTAPTPQPGPVGNLGMADLPDPTEIDLPDLDDLAESLDEPLREATVTAPAGEPIGQPSGAEGRSIFTPSGWPREGLSLSAPEDWRTTQEPGANVALLAGPDRGDGLPVEVLITWQDLGGKTVKEVADSGRQALGAGLGDFEEQSFEAATLAGHNAYRLHATYLAGDGTGREVETWWVEGAEGTLYVLNASRSDVGDPNDWRDARSVIASLTFDGA